MLADYPYIRDVIPPLDAHQLRPLDPKCEVVQFAAPLSDDDHRKLSGFLRAYPRIPLRAYAHYGEEADLDFLRFYPTLTEFQSDLYGLISLDGLGYLPESLSFLALGQTKKQHSLKALARFRGLKNLHLEGHAKDIDVLSALTDLERLSLRSLTLSGLELLLPLAKLKAFELRLGGTKDLARLPEIGRIEYLELWMVKGLSNLGFLPRIDSLRSLFLQSLKHVTELPSFAALKNLRRVHLETMKGVTDLASVAAAPALEELLLIDMGHLQPDALKPFIGHKTLRAANIGLNSLKKNAAAEAMLRLPKVMAAEPAD